MHDAGLISTPDGTTLATRSWPGSLARENVVIVHGYLEHCNRYRPLASYFNNNGYNVFSYDQRGHGRSGGSPSYIRDFKVLVKDFEFYINALHAELNDRYFIMSHSMGGLVVLSALLLNNFRDDRLAGLIFSAPFISPSSELAPIIKKVSRILGAILPKFPTIPADPNAMSRDPVAVREYKSDPLIYHGRVHAGSARQLLIQMEKLRPHYRALDLPFLILHGTDDKVAEFRGSDMLFLESRSSNKKLIPLKEYKHEILKEYGKEKVMQSMVNWMDAQLLNKK